MRLEDNTGLYHALSAGLPVLPFFIYDKEILNKLTDRNDRRVLFISLALEGIHKELLAAGSSLKILHSTPENAFRQLVSDYDIQSVYANHDYEPYALERDETLKVFLKESGIGFFTFKDQVIFEKGEVVKDSGLPYTIFTPYKNKWLAGLKPESFKTLPSEKKIHAFYKTTACILPLPEDIGFRCSPVSFPSSLPDDGLLKLYHGQRDFPALNATSRLSIHLRFGTVSIRSLAEKARLISSTWLNELIWREFYMMILFHFPHVVKGAFKPAYDRVRWRNNEDEFERWCNGLTGFPIVDAGMRELKETGFMHNRLRMITASFLVKDLLIDWRWGEAWFAEKLLDYELASNNGGWQWTAGTGCDAAPYFRIFNPAEQTKKFDAGFSYISKWVPEWQSDSYPSPVTDHKLARIRTLEAFKTALSADKK